MLQDPRKVVCHHGTPLPAINFIASTQDCAESPKTSYEMQGKYNLDYASCIGALIYLSYTRADIIFTVNKLAKFTKNPGEYHIEALLNLLRYLGDNVYLGIKYYRDQSQSPLHDLLLEVKIDVKNLLVTFSNSSWHDNVGNGCMGGVVDQSSNLPDPVVLSLTESEYNEACLACMATSHLKMLLNELKINEGLDTTIHDQVPVLLNNHSAINMGNSYKDTKHTRHIMRHITMSVKESQINNILCLGLALSYN